MSWYVIWTTPLAMNYHQLPSKKSAGHLRIFALNLDSFGHLAPTKWSFGRVTWQKSHNVPGTFTIQKLPEFCCLCDVASFLTHILYMLDSKGVYPIYMDIVEMLPTSSVKPGFTGCCVLFPWNPTSCWPNNFNPGMFWVNISPNLPPGFQEMYQNDHRKSMPTALNACTSHLK